jgi:LysM repeat protein
VPEAAGTEYVVVKGDSFAKIAKKNGVSVKAIEAANPGVAPTKLKVGQKLSIPAAVRRRGGAGNGGAQASGWFEHGRRSLHGEIRRYADQDCEGARHHRQGDQSRKQSDDGPHQSRAEAEDSGESRSCGSGSGTRAGSSCARARTGTGHDACAPAGTPAGH